MSFVTCLTTPNQGIGRTEQFESFTYTSKSQIQWKLKSTGFSINFILNEILKLFTSVLFRRLEQLHEV